MAWHTQRFSTSIQYTCILHDVLERQCRHQNYDINRYSQRYTNNNVGTNTSKQQLWLKGWGGSLHTNTSCRVVPGRLSLGRRETGGMCTFCLPACISLIVCLSISHPARRHATDHRQILINKLDLVILSQRNFRQTARRNGISSLARRSPPRTLVVADPHPLSHSASSLKLASKSLLPTCTASNLVQSLDACSTFPILSHHLTPEHAT